MSEDENYYYLDLDYLSEFCAIKALTPPEEPDGDEIDEQEKIETITTGIDVFKYEIIKMCLDKLLFTNENREEETDYLLKKDDENSASYSLAFNTLRVHKIIKKYEREYLKITSCIRKD